MTIVAGIVVAAAATLGDFIWYTVGVRHTMVAGLVDGALLLTAVGGAIGTASGRLAKGLPLGTLPVLAGPSATTSSSSCWIRASTARRFQAPG